MSDVEKKESQKEQFSGEQFSGDGTARPSAAEARFSGGGEKASDKGGDEISQDARDQCIKEIGVAYDFKYTNYWRPTPQGGVIKIGTTQLERYLANNYFHLLRLPKNYNDIAKADKAKAFRIAMGQLVEEIENRCYVQYVGPMAGYRIGYQIIDSIPVLINEDPVYITPKKKDYKIIADIRDNMFNRSSGGDDWLYFDIWIKLSRAALFGGNFRPGVILVLVGVASTCKTLVKELILTPAFGGRMADVFRYVSGGSEFNDSSIRAELECIDDKRAKNRNVKDLVGGYIKERAGSARSVLHPKGRPEFERTMFKRLFVGCNPTPLDLAILPTITDEAVFAKMLLLRTVRFAYPNKQYTPLPTATDAERDELARAIREALPGYFWYLDHELIIPDRLKDNRFGVMPYCNPIIRVQLERDLPVNLILELISNLPHLFHHRQDKVTVDLPYKEAIAADWFDWLHPYGINKYSTSVVDFGRKFSEAEERGHPLITSRILNGERYYKIANVRLK